MTRKELDEKILSAYSAFSEKHIENSLLICSEALEQCTGRGYLRGVGGCHALLSNIYAKKQEWNLAIAEAEQAHTFYEQMEDKLSAAYRLYDIAYLHSQMEQGAKAIEYCKKTLKEFQELDDIRGEAEAYSLLGVILSEKSEYETALEYLEKSYTLKVQLHDLDGAGSDCINLAAIYLLKDENARAIGYLHQAIELKEQYKSELDSGAENVGFKVYSYDGYKLLRKSNDSTLSDAYLNLGTALSAMGNHIQAVEAYDTALKMKQTLGEKYGEAVAYNQLGCVFIERNDSQQAEWYLLQARPLFESLGHKHSEGTVWFNLGRIYVQTGRWNEAEQALEKAEELFRELDNPYDELFILQQKVSLAIETKQFENAEHHIRRGLGVSNALEAKEFEAEFLLHLANVQSITGTITIAIETCNKALQIAKKQKLLSQEVNILQMLSTLYKKNGDFSQALEVFEQFHTVQEQIIHTESARYLSGMQVIHETEIHRKNEELAHSQINHLESLIKINNQSILMYKKELNTFRMDILSITKQLDKAENIIRKVRIKLQESPVMQETWESYLETFTKVHPNFQSNLRRKFPELTTMEVRVCVLIRAELHSEEISQILSLSARTIENHRFNLRKKLGIAGRGSLSKFLAEI
ncbi:MAG: tetratricopeptide repeat protein [Bacteroidetes bacterium]|nr:tetratricopeptide repeat protein [Bacteroidota bacterium]